MERIITRVPVQHTQALKLTKVAGYARVSSDKDAMLHSLAAQVDYYQKLILGNTEWMYAGVYADVNTPYGQNAKARECLI